LLELGIDLPLIPNGQALQPRKYELMFYVGALVESVIAAYYLLIPLFEQFDKVYKLLFAHQFPLLVKIIKLELRVLPSLEENLDLRIVQGTGLMGYYILERSIHHIRIIEPLKAKQKATKLLSITFGISSESFREQVYILSALILILIY
jgi:hypothetical protein